MEGNLQEKKEIEYVNCMNVKKDLVRDLEKWYFLRPYFNIHIFCCDENKKCTLCYGDVMTVNSST